MPTGRLDTLADRYRTDANNLNAIRLLLAGLVIASHSYIISLGQAAGSAAEPLGRLARHRTDMGSLAVDGFFAISGFLWAASWSSGKRGGY
jgi:peptidoglycan/LPS O-acetylase OafA/YrhL